VKAAELMHNPVVMIVPLCGLFVAFLGFRRSLATLNKLRGERGKLMRNMMISAFIGALCVSSAALAYIVWFYNRNPLLLISGTVGSAIFVVSAVLCILSCVRISKLAPEC